MNKELIKSDGGNGPMKSGNLFYYKVPNPTAIISAADEQKAIETPCKPSRELFV